MIHAQEVARQRWGGKEEVMVDGAVGRLITCSHGYWSLTQK